MVIVAMLHGWVGRMEQARCRTIKMGGVDGVVDVVVDGVGLRGGGGGCVRPTVVGLDATERRAGGAP